MVQFLRAKSNKQHDAHVIVRRNVNKWFWEVKVGDVDRSKSWEYENLIGSHKMHQVRSISYGNPTLLQYRELLCLCVHCVD